MLLHLEQLGRCIAPDLVGMPDSDKLPDSRSGSYCFLDRRRYADGLLQELGVYKRVTLVVHDWGSALGFDLASRHADAVQWSTQCDAQHVLAIPDLALETTAAQARWWEPGTVGR